MNNLYKMFDVFKENQTYVFFDFEACQFTHYPIEIGLIVTFYKDNYFKILEEYKKYIYTDNKIGNYVEKLTSINKELLKNEGVLFKDVIYDLSRIFSKYSNKTYISYSKDDKRILKKAINFNNLNEKFIYEEILKNYLDLQKYFSLLIQNNEGFYSIKKLIELFNIKEINIASLHDSLYDSKAMIYLLNKLFLNKNNLLSLNDEIFFNKSNNEKEVIIKGIMNNYD